MTRAIIFKGNIDNNLWPKLILAIMYINNNWPMRVVQNLSPHKIYIHKLLNIFHLQILSSTVYVFLYQEEQMLKSEKWASRTLKKTLVGHNSHTIY